MYITPVIDDILEIPASRAWHKTIQIDSILGVVKLVGWSVASGGARNDIKVLFLDDIDFYNWKNFGKVNPIYQSGKISTANITAEIKKPGRYHLVFSNWFSEFSLKKVIAKVYLYWSVKPLIYEIKPDGLGTLVGDEIKTGDIVLDGDYFQIPGPGANITLKFMALENISDFQVKKEEKDINVSANVSKSGVIFFTPTPADEPYEFTCGNGTLEVKGEFKVISPEPVIGQGLTISSSMANSPPKLDKIGNKDFSKTTLGKEVLAFRIRASDPDDDVLTYYAFNLPMVITGEKDNVRTWGPAATLEKDSGRLIWTEASANLTEGKYFIRFEVSDGLLSDHEDIIITIAK